MVLVRPSNQGEEDDNNHRSERAAGVSDRRRDS
jgi:hypothetical protein